MTFFNSIDKIQDESRKYLYDGVIVSHVTVENKVFVSSFKRKKNVEKKILT